MSEDPKTPTFSTQRTRPLRDLFENIGDTSDEIELVAKKLNLILDDVASLLDGLKSGGGLELGVKIGNDYIPISVILKFAAQGRITQKEANAAIRTTPLDP